MERGRWNGGDWTKRARFKRTPEIVAAVLVSDEGSTILAKRLGVSKPTILRIRQAHGVLRTNEGPPRKAQKRVYEYLVAHVDERGFVQPNQTEIAKALNMAHSNVSIAIKRLQDAGRVVRTGKPPSIRVA